MQLSLMTCQLSTAALGQHPSLRNRDEAVPWTRDTHFLAGIRKVSLGNSYWESLPIFLLPLARLLGQLTPGSLCLVSTQHGNADQGCLAFRDRQENRGVGKLCYPVGQVQGMPLELPKAVPWKPLGAGTLAHCWGTDGGLVP